MMDNAGKGLHGPDEMSPGRTLLPTTTVRVDVVPGATPALTRVVTETLSMESVARFFDGRVEPQGNTLVSEMVDENGPLAGRESARAKRSTGSLAMQFSDDDDRSTLFAPNDAPDELPPEQTEAGKLLRQQEFRHRRWGVA